MIHELSQNSLVKADSSVRPPAENGILGLVHMLIGYARVSTHDQTLHLQRDALERVWKLWVVLSTIVSKRDSGTRRSGIAGYYPATCG
jgi:hypothetical protein